MRLYPLLLRACAFALALLFLAPAAALATTTMPPTEDIQAQIDLYRKQVWHWQRVMGHPVTPTLAARPAQLIERLPLWQAKAERVKRTAQRVPHRGAWLCIHRYEGSWSDRGAPYYGGLQMDIGFQSTYGRYLLSTKGTADHWSPLEQMWVAERAYRSGRGFYPWPNTARSCGLI
ncbi:MAG: Transglycosylase-like domain [Gaiellaceae bacterium]|jgi:hypothetical protein|nr:Transglycosylase-like domain [Gaiellaceae bacterium]